MTPMDGMGRILDWVGGWGLRFGWNDREGSEVGK